MAGFKDFADGNVLTGDEVDGYLMKQAVMRFADAAARNTALASVVSDGMVAFTEDDDTWWLRSGGVWWGYDAEWKTYTPAWTSQTTQPALGNGTLTGRYQREGRTVNWHFRLTAGTTTTFGTGGYFFTLPPFAVRTTFGASAAPMGDAIVQDVSAGLSLPRAIVDVNNSAVILVDAAGARVSATVPVTLANTDVITGAGFYEYDA